MKERSSFASYLSLNEVKGWLINMKVTVTIARSYGSGGKEIGKELAKQIGAKYYGREIIEMLRGEETYDGDDESISTLDEATKQFEQQAKLIHSLAENDSCVIVGRCADYVLRDMDNVIKVYLYAPIRNCVKRVSRLYELNPDEAKNLVRSMNKTRGDYYEHNTGRKWSEITNYDLCLNTAGLETEQCVEIIKNFIQTKIG